MRVMVIRAADAWRAMRVMVIWAALSGLRMTRNARHGAEEVKGDSELDFHLIQWSDLDTPVPFKNELNLQIYAKIYLGRQKIDHP